MDSKGGNGMRTIPNDGGGKLGRDARFSKSSRVHSHHSSFYRSPLISCIDVVSNLVSVAAAVLIV